MAGEYSNLDVHVGAFAAPGAYTVTVTGGDGVRTHTATTVLNVQPTPVSTFAATPNAGSGSSQTFTFVAFGQGGRSNPESLNILFNSSVDGRHACWIYADASFVTLASDDGTIWTPVAWGTYGNSQCTISGTTVTYIGDRLIVATQITFSDSLRGTKSIYLRTTNNYGSDTGYQPEGTWIIP